MKKPLIYTACLTLSLLGLTLNAGAQGSVGYVQAWDNNDPNPPGDGTWDTNTASWTSSGATQGSPVAFTNGNFALFAAGSTVSPTNTITLSGPITVQGFGDGSVNGTATGAAITGLNLSGPGSLNLPDGLWEVNCGVGANRIFAYVPITGTGGLVQRDSGWLYLLGTNTYSGGTTVTGGQVLFYNNGASFGTGPVTNNSSSSIWNFAAPTVVTLTNTFVITNGGVLNFAAGQTTLTGPWILKSSAQLKNNGASTTTVTFAGPISGPFGVYYQCPNAGKITVSGSNTYTGLSFIGYSTGTSPENVSVSSINSVANPPQQSSSSLGVPSSVANGTISMGFSNSSSALIYTGPGETSDRVIALTGTTGGATIEMDGTGPLVLTSSFTAPTNGAKTLTLQGTSTATNTIMGAIVNSTSATSLTKAQAGNWVLTGTNTFTGATTISGGTLSILGNGRLNSGSYAGAITDNATFIYNGALAQTLSGVISGTGTLTKAGTATLTLSGNNTYTGNTTNSAGVIVLNKPETNGTSGPLGKSTAVGSIVMGGGTLQYTANNNADYSGRFSTAAGQLYNLDVNGQAVAYATSLSSSTGQLTLSSTAAGGSLTLNAPASYSGGTTINSGQLILGSGGSLGNGSYSVNITDNGALIYNGTGSQTFSGTISGTGSLTQNGPGPMILTTSNTYSGSTTLGATGNLYLTNSGSISNSVSLAMQSGSLLDVSGLGLSSYTVTSSNFSASGISSTPSTINGAAASTVNFGTQPMTLSISPDTFTGATQPALVINQGLVLNGNVVTVVNASGTALGVGNYTLIQPANGTTGTVNPNVVVSGSGIQGGLYAKVQITGGNVVLSVLQPANVGPTWNGNDYATSHNWSHGANWVGGTPPDATGDQVIIANTSPQSPVMDSSYSVFSLTFNPGTASDNLVASGGSILSVGAGVTNSSGNLQTLALPVNLVELGSSNVASQWDVTGGNMTVSGVISDNATGLAVSGGNTLTLSGANTYSGTTTINGATLSANTVADAPSSIGTGPLALAGGGTFAFTGASGTTARTVSVSGSTTTTINVPGSSTVSLNGQVHAVSDTAAQMLTLTGGGTLNLGGSADNSGLTMAINSGKVVITKASASNVHGLGSGVTTIGTGSGGNSAGLQLSGSGNFDLFSGTQLIVNSPDGYVDLNGQSNSFSTMTLSGAGPNGTGALINSATGTTASITNGGGAVILVGDTMMGGAGNIRLASAVNGTNVALTYAGSGTLTLAAVGNYNNGTTVTSGGTLQVTAGSTTLNSGAGSGTITLNGNAVLNLSMTNTSMNTPFSGGSSSAVDIFMGAGNLFLSNSTASELNNFAGTYDVNTTATNGGQLVIGTAAFTMTINPSSTWRIRAGAVVDFNVGQSNPGTVYLYGAPYTGATLGSLRLDDSVQSGNVILMGDSQIGNGSAVGPSTISGVISGSFGFTKVSPNPVVLTAANTYTGNTAINVGALTLTGTGSINNSSNISIAAGATFDVSGLASSTYTWSGSTSLSASGTGTATNTAATINGASGGTVSLASQPISLTYTPTSTNGDATHPSLNIAQATLQLNNNAITVNNASAQPLGLGTYTIIQDAAGLITGTPNATATVTGTGLAAGTSGSISVSGGSVNLVVATAVVPNPPTISSVVKSGSNFIFSGTNGPANGTYVVLTSTNVATHLNLWTPVSTNTFSPTGAFSVTNNITNSRSFFVIEIPN